MEKKVKTNFMLTVLAVLVIAIFAPLSSLAWFADSTKIDMSVEAGALPGYFGGGNGTENSPYLIKNPRHLYNLSWLQYKGSFPEKTYFRLENNIDMAGSLKNGAVPPIGTEEHPFLGDFDGNGKVISNLWVSSDIEDWIEQPDNVTEHEVGSKVGFFGAINQENSIPANARNFVLENLEVTSDAAGARVGLVAGYANGNLSHIGIKNGKISLKDQNTVASETVLIGEVGDAVDWENRPGMQGGHVKIDPTVSYGNAIANNTSVPVPESSDGCAYYVGALDRATYNANSAKLVFNNTIQWQAGASGTSNTYTAEATSTSTATAENTDPDLYARITMKGKITYIKPATTATAPSSSNLYMINGIGLNVPKNGIWFKPSQGGTCMLATTITSKNKNSSLSLYSYNRDANGNIQNWGEITLVGHRNLGNQTIIAFKVEIPQTAVNEGYEFVVGKSSGDGNDSAGFDYLILTGAGNQSVPDGQTSVKILNVDYAVKTGSGETAQYDILTQGENYEVKNVALNFGMSSEYTTTGSTAFNFNTDASGNVHYDNNTVIRDTAGTGTVGVYDPNSASYPPRQTG